MKSTIFTFFFIMLFFSSFEMKSAITRAPEDFFGRVTAPYGTEVEVLKFKSDQIVYAGTNGAGLYVSYDGGTNWVNISTFPSSAFCIKDILITASKELFVATYGSGIYYSKDNGATWQERNKGLKNLYTQAITQTKWGMLVCGTYGGGAYYSIDNGTNWIRTDKGLRYDNITCLTSMNTGFIIAGTNGGGFYVSRDSCKTWLVSNTLLENTFINDVAKDESGKVYAATNGAGVMMTGDGITWVTYSNKFHYKDDPIIRPLLDTAIVTVGANKYQMVMGTRSAGMYFWDDLWNLWQNSGDFTVGITACDVSPNGTILATRSLGDVVRSTNNGMKWDVVSKQIVKVDYDEYSSASGYMDVVLNDFNNSLYSYAKTNNVRVVSKSDNYGIEWKILGTINSDRAVNDIEISPEENIFLAADDGVYASLDSGKTYNKVLNPTDKKPEYWKFYEVEYDSISKAWICSYTYMFPDTNKPPSKPYLELENRLYKTTNNGISWTYVNYKETGISNIKIIKDSWYMLQGSGFYQSTNQGANYTKLFSAPNGKIFYGKDGNLYTYNTNTNELFYCKGFTGVWTKIDFTPYIYDPNGYWYIENFGVDCYGVLFVDIKISNPLQGMTYEAYTSSDFGKNWKQLRGCYNMYPVRKFESDYRGNIFMLTNALYKSLNSKSLKPPKVTAPKNNKLGEEINPILAWEKSFLAEEYELQLDETDLFYQPFETNVTGDSLCKIALDLSYNTEYAWRIRSKTHSARSAWFDKNYFTVGVQPPLLISPKKGETGVSLDAKLLWHKIPEVTHFSIQVAEDPNFEKIVFSKDNHIDTTITTSRLVGLKNYYWRVKAYTNNNASSWSEVWNFRTVLGPPALVSPKNNSIDRLLTEQFIWKKAIEAETYYMQIATDSEFKNIFFEGNTGADTFANVKSLIAETDYFWRVASVNSEGTSEYSEVWTFRTSLKPVILLTPSNNLVNIPLNTKFTWEQHNAGNEYQIQISNTEDFKNPIVDVKLNNVVELQTNKLEFYKKYFWRVRLIIGNRVGLWSDTWNFKTGIDNPILINPPDKSIDQPSAIRFRWNEVFGAEYYQLQISKNIDFTDLVYSTDSLTKTEQYVDKLEPEILYYWRVKVWNKESFGTSQWSEIWTFTTGEVTLILRNPKDNTQNYKIPSLLTWFGASTAEYYKLQVAEDKDFTKLIVNKDSIYDTKYTIEKDKIATSTQYFWRVIGIGKTYNTPWSDVWTFTTSATGVIDDELLQSIEIFPNPATSSADLTFEYLEFTNATLIITNISGKAILKEAISINAGKNIYKIDVTNLVSGSYYISIITPNGSISKELLIQK